MMKKSLGTAALALLLTIPVTLQIEAAPALIPVSAGNVDRDRLPQRHVMLGNVAVTPDIAYSTLHGYRPMLLDLYQPNDRLAHPLVIFIHGGSWTSGSKRTTGAFTDFPALLASLSSRGFVVASVDYRLSGEARYPAALNDIKAAIRHLRANAQQYGIDPNRIAVWGASAGAHLAALAAYTGDDLDFEQPGMANAEQSDRVQAFVGWYGTYEMGSIFRQKGTSSAAEAAAEAPGPLKFFGCTSTGCPPGMIEQASPINHIDAGDPPSLIIHGSADTTVPATQSRTLDERLKASGVSSRFILIDGVSHSWIGKEPQSTQKASRQAVAATFDWLEQTLLKKR